MAKTPKFRSENLPKRKRKVQDDGLRETGVAEGAIGYESLNITKDTKELAVTESASRRKPKKKKVASTEEIDMITGTNEAQINTNEALTDPNAEEAQAGKGQRFIVFVGNLPYSATADSISKHFTKVSPASVRLITEKGSNKPKGFAFLEFDRFDKMKTCLKLYHHSLFNDGASPARKINIELTAGGGGGKSQARRSRLQTKNDKLNEERKRHIKQREKAKQKRKGKPDSNLPTKDENSAPKTNEAKKRRSEDYEDIHPSRRAQVDS